MPNTSAWEAEAKIFAYHLLGLLHHPLGPCNLLRCPLNLTRLLLPLHHRPLPRVQELCVCAPWQTEVPARMTWLGRSPGMLGLRQTGALESHFGKLTPCQRQACGL